VCGSSFDVREQKSLVCEKNHCFDFAAKGYVNFIPNQKQVSDNYSKKLFESRAAVFESGAYDKVLETLSHLLSNNDFLISRCENAGGVSNRSKTNLLDVGCGEGYYAAKLSEREDINVFAIDIIKEAILASCKRKTSVKWMVADLTNIPMKDNSVDILLNILTSANYQEFSRVMSADGIIIKVIPGDEYLKEIRALLKPQLRNKEYSNESVVEHLEKHVNVLKLQEIHYEFPVDEYLTELFVQMTPLASGVETQGLDFTKILSVTINLNVVIGKIKPEVMR